jgi:hypothetical protein
MEKYYRWVSRRYANEFGKLHHDLVKTIFRYNNRHTRGRYVATLAGTRKPTKGEKPGDRRRFDPGRQEGGDVQVLTGFEKEDGWGGVGTSEGSLPPESNQRQ